MKKYAVILSSLAFLLTACSAAPADSVSATPVPTETPAPTAEPTPEPTATPSPTPAPTMAVYDEVSFGDWRDGAGCTMPDYTFSAPHKPQPQEQVTWPTDGVTLCYNAKTLEEAAVRAKSAIDESTPLLKDGHNVLLVAHAHILRILTSQWLGVDPHFARLLRLDTAHYSVLSVYKGDNVIERWNA